MNSRLGILIPVYNERENIGETIESIEREVKTPHRIYIIYDFPEDNTLSVARMFQLKGINLEFIRNPSGGVSHALRRGFKEAREDYVMVTMADLSDDYRVADDMCRVMEKGYDVVCGSRYMEGGKQIGGPLFKKALSRLAGVSLRYLAGLPVHDITNNFKLYRRSMIDSITIESCGFEIGMEVTLKAHFSGLRVTEIPCVWHGRKRGKSRFKFLQWAPKYLTWYFFALREATRRNRKTN